MYRQRIPETTLINPNGFHATGSPKKDSERTIAYYRGIMDFVLFQIEQGLDYTLVFDRFFFSEQVFSTLYKKYDFTDYYNRLMIVLDGMAEISDVYVVHVKADTSTINNRLINRSNKVQYDDVLEDVKESMSQSNVYRELFKDINSKINFVELDVSDKTQEEVFEDLLAVTTK
jgi:deoxyadenosine/deoxycytidine kinase